MTLQFPFSTLQQQRYGFPPVLYNTTHSYNHHSQLHTSLSCTHLSAAYISQLHTSLSCTHLSAAHISQLHTSLSCIHLSAAHVSQLHTSLSCTHLSAAHISQLHTSLSCTHLSAATFPARDTNKHRTRTHTRIQHSTVLNMLDSTMVYFS